MIRGAGAQATSGVARDAALELCAAGASALDAVVGGWFALSVTLDVLLAPLVVFVGGAGAPREGRAFDGRALVGGLGSRRPRGASSEADAPVVSRAAVPRSLAAVTLAHGYFGRTSLASLAAPVARSLAKASLPERAAFVESIGALGASALRPHTDDVLRVAGRTAGGPLTEADLEGARPREAPGRDAPGGWTELPHDASGDGHAEVVLAADGRGLVAGLAVSLTPMRSWVPELGCALPGGAPPVVRGAPRPKAGGELGAAGSLWLAHLEGAVLLVGSGEAERRLPDIGRALDALDGAFTGPWVGLLRTPQEARPLGRLGPR